MRHDSVSKCVGMIIYILDLYKTDRLEDLSDLSLLIKPICYWFCRITYADDSFIRVDMYLSRYSSRKMALMLYSSARNDLPFLALFQDSRLFLSSYCSSLSNGGECSRVSISQEQWGRIYIYIYVVATLWHYIH